MGPAPPARPHGRPRPGFFSKSLISSKKPMQPFPPFCGPKNAVHFYSNSNLQPFFAQKILCIFFRMISTPYLSAQKKYHDVWYVPYFTAPLFGHKHSCANLLTHFLGHKKTCSFQTFQTFFLISFRVKILPCNFFTKFSLNLPFPGPKKYIAIIFEPYFAAFNIWTPKVPCHYIRTFFFWDPTLESKNSRAISIKTYFAFATESPPGQGLHTEPVHGPGAAGRPHWGLRRRESEAPRARHAGPPHCPSLYPTLPFPITSFLIGLQFYNVSVWVDEQGRGWGGGGGVPPERMQPYPRGRRPRQNFFIPTLSSARSQPARIFFPAPEPSLLRMSKFHLRRVLQVVGRGRMVSRGSGGQAQQLVFHQLVFPPSTCFFSSTTTNGDGNVNFEIWKQPANKLCDFMEYSPTGSP